VASTEVANTPGMFALHRQDVMVMET